MKRMCETCGHGKWPGKVFIKKSGTEQFFTPGSWVDDDQLVSCRNPYCMTSIPDEGRDFVECPADFWCSAWKPKERGKCGECERFSAKNNKLEVEFNYSECPNHVQVQRALGKNNERGACTANCNTQLRPISLNPKSDGCGDWMPKEGS